MRPNFLFTCEHADFKTPKFLRSDPLVSASVLKSHRGWDQGALPLAQGLSRDLAGTCISYPYSRLYLDANRKISAKALSPYTRDLEPEEQDKLFQLCRTYRERIWREVERGLQRKRTLLFFSVHTFVPVLQGQRRQTEIGLLFRRQRRGEEALAQALRKNLKALAPQTHTHFNRPYRGHTDCLFNDVMDEFRGETRLKGLFLEINQGFIRKKGSAGVRRLLSQAIGQLPAEIFSK